MISETEFDKRIADRVREFATYIESGTVEVLTYSCVDADSKQSVYELHLTLQRRDAEQKIDNSPR